MSPYRNNDKYKLIFLVPTVDLEREPGQSEESHHHHQHLDDLEVAIIYICQLTVIDMRVRDSLTFFLLFITMRSLCSWAVPGVRVLQSFTAILMRMLITNLTSSHPHTSHLTPHTSHLTHHILTPDT